MAAKAGLDLPNLGRRQDTGKGRILAQARAFVILSAQDRANLVEGPLQNLPPFGVTAQERRRVGIQPRPPIQILARDTEQFRRSAQPGRNAPTHFQANIVMEPVIHPRTI